MIRTDLLPNISPVPLTLLSGFPLQIVVSLLRFNLALTQSLKKTQSTNSTHPTIELLLLHKWRSTNPLRRGLLPLIFKIFPLKRDSLPIPRSFKSCMLLFSLASRSPSGTKGSAVVSVSVVDSCTSNSPPITKSITFGLSALRSVLAFSDSRSFIWGFSWSSLSVRSSLT